MKDLAERMKMPPGDWIPTTVEKPPIGKPVYCFNGRGGIEWLTLNSGGQWVSHTRFDPAPMPTFWYRESATADPTPGEPTP